MKPDCAQNLYRFYAELSLAHHLPPKFCLSSGLQKIVLVPFKYAQTAIQSHL